MGEGREPWGERLGWEPSRVTRAPVLGCCPLPSTKEHPMDRTLRPGLVAFGLAALFACGGDDAGAPIPDACNPLGSESCMMPWPSSAYLIEDAATTTGFRLAIPAEAMPINIDRIRVDPTRWNAYDGFGPSGVLLAAFPGGVAADGLPSHGDVSASLAADAPVILLNMETGARVAFFAEVDMNTEDAAKRALIIHPLERMAPATRHAVAIRTSVKGPGGAALPIPPGFQAILDGATFDHPLMDRIQPGYDAIFAALAAEGVAREDLVLAWDFVTASDEFLTSDLRAMRERALPAMGERGANLTFTTEELSGDPSRVHRLYLGTYTAPNFLDDGEHDFSVLLRDSDDLPALDGWYTANFAATIPACVTTAELPIPLVVFGHGLFGNAEDYLDDRFLQQVAQDHCFVIVGGDWIGLTNRQITIAAFSANDLNRSHGIVEKLAQAVINFIALEQLARGPLAESSQFHYQGQPIIDTERVYYLGASLGGIMGGVFMSYDPTIVRGALGVPGAAWSLLIERSFAWSPLQIAALAAYEDQLIYQQLIALLGLSFERVDPITTAPRVLTAEDPLLAVPQKQLLLYEAVGDSLVSNLSTELFARTLAIPVCGPTLRQPFGLDVDDGPVSSALTIYDEKPDPLPPETNVPPYDDNGTHSDVNERPAVLRQVKTFFFDGEIRSECRKDGAPAVCDCTMGACE
jgi:hypothetical protein